MLHECLVSQSRSSCPLPCTCPQFQGAASKLVLLIPGCSLCSLGFKSPWGNAALLSLSPVYSHPQDALGYLLAHWGSV